MDSFVCKAQHGCVRSGLLGVCRAARTGNSRLCCLADATNPAYSPAYHALLRDEAPTWLPLAPPVRNSAARAPRKVDPQVRDALARVTQIKACPHWQASTTCGCGINLCALGKGNDGKVSHKDCLECLQKQDEQANPQNQLRE